MNRRQGTWPIGLPTPPPQPGDRNFPTLAAPQTSSVARPRPPEPHTLPRPDPVWLRFPPGREANWDDVAEEIWRRPEDFGAQFQSQPIPETIPLPQNQLDWLREYTSSERIGWNEGRAASKFRDIQFSQRLGDGFAAQVWLVWAWKSSHEKVGMACKVIRKGIGVVYNVRDMLIDMRVLRQAINHDNIVKMFDFVVIPDLDSGFPFASALIFMETCNGTANEVFLEYGRRLNTGAPEQVCKHFFRQFAEGIRYLHSINITHGDAHVGNILYVSRIANPLQNEDLDQSVMAMTFKLADFGFSTIFPQTMSTEQIEELYEKTTNDIYFMAGGLAMAKCGHYIHVNLDQIPGFKVQIHNSLYRRGASAQFIDLIQKMLDQPITADDVLSHPWLRQI